MASSDGRDDNCAGTSADAGGVAGGHSGGELRASSWDHTVDSCSASSTCTPYWDSDDDDPGPRPSELYGKFTWKIEKFSEISNRELRSNVFEVGGYKWYILVYPQGCDVCNHLSLFLCVSDYDKLLPGWSHFAQFTIAVVNKDPKKSKYSDTLHRFCKKEHDWGWKKFMELSKVLDGFIVADILVIKAQVQVIRENPSRPFRCLDIQYRRELVRVYLTNVEGICRRFVEEKRERLAKMIEDTTKWSSFRTFWSAIDQSFRHRLSREKTDVILKAIVKRFFNEKEVTSTLVMDALYSGCKALNYRTKGKKEKSSNLDGESVYPVVCVEKDQFVLADDVLALLERAATEQLPPSKEDKAPQNRTKDCSGDDFAKDSVERDERRLTELGKRTIEIFVLAHLFGRVEVAYKEAIALKRQEELIREEEAAGQAEIEFKAKREAAEKDKKSKKKQAKQRRNNKKDKSRGREEKTSSIILQKEQLETSIRKLSIDNCSEDCATPNAKILALADEDDDLSGVDTTDNVVGTLGPAIEDGEAYRGDWDRDGSETHQSMEAGFSGDVSMPQAQSGRAGRKQQSTIDDSSSTCSTDSLASVVPNGSYKGKNALGNHNQLLNRGKIKSTNEKRGKSSSTVVENENHKASSTDSSMMQETSSSMAGVSSETVILSLKERVQWLEQRLAEKEEEVVMLQEKLSLQQHQIDEMKSNKQAQDKAKELSEKKDSVQLTTQSNDCKVVSPCVLVDALSTTQNKESMDSPSTSSVGNNILHQRNNLPRSSSAKSNNPCKNDIVKTQVHHTNTTDNSRPTQKSSAASDNNSNSNPGTSNGSSDVSGLSRPSSAPLIPGVSKPNVPIVPLQTAPSLSRSVSASGRLGVAETTGLNPTMLSQSNPVTPSYKMAAVGKIRSSYNGSVPFPAANSSQGSNMSNAALVMQNVIPSTVSSSSTTPAMKQESQRTAMSNECSSTQTRVDASSPSFKGPGIPTQTSSVNVQGKEHTAHADAHQPERPVGFTFGSVTPEMLNRQRAQDYAQSLDDSLSRIDENSLKANENQQKNTLEHYVNQQSQGLQNLNFFHSRSGQDSHESRTQSTSNSTQAHKGPFYSPYAEVRQPHPVASEEFPHIDIINDLLDDEHYRGKALSMMMEQSDGHHPHRRVPFSNFERFNHNHMLDLNVVKGERLDISRLQDEGMYQLHSSDNASIGMREGLHMLPPYSPYAQSFSQQGGMFDGVPHHWPITSGDFAGGSMNGNAYGAMSPHMAYPMHANPMSLGDCSSFSSGQTDYAMFSPRKDM